MRRLLQSALLGGLAGFTLMGCENHEFEVTKVLHESHGGYHGEDHSGEHGGAKGHEGHEGHEGHAQDNHAEGEGKPKIHKPEKEMVGEGRDVGL